MRTRTPFLSLSLAACILIGLGSATERSAMAQPAKKKGAGVRVPDTMEAVRNLDYAGTGAERQTLDLYVPKDKSEKRPLIVWVHGGGWKAGSKETPQIAWVLDHGYALASINYRLSQQAVFPAQIHDCKGAIRFLRAHADKYGYDARRIGIAGSSAGGHLVALLGTSGDVKDLEGDVGGNTTHSSRVQAVLDFFGPTDFVTMVTQPSRIDRSKGEYPEAQLLGETVQANPEKAKRASPATYVSADDPPFLIYQGTKDELVPDKQSIDFTAALKGKSVSADLVLVEGGGHGGPAFFSEEAARNKQLAFFDKFLKTK